MMVVAPTNDDNGDDDQSNIIGKWKLTNILKRHHRHLLVLKTMNAS